MCQLINMKGRVQQKWGKKKLSVMNSNVHNHVQNQMKTAYQIREGLQTRSGPCNLEKASHAQGI
jgi:hypothetical protein